jgi:ABC-2 type transport system permease protein
LACVIISMTDILPGLNIRHDLVWYTVVYRGLLSVVPGAWFPTLQGGAAHPHTEINTPDELANAIDLTRSWQAFASADLWIGAAIGVALIVGAIHLRRWRESE